MTRTEFDNALTAYSIRRYAEESPLASLPWVARLISDVVDKAVELAYPEPTEQEPRA